MAVPFSMTGGVLAPLAFGDTINMYSNIGLITLIGLVTKNSFMIIEFTNRLRKNGKRILEAVLEVAKLRNNLYLLSWCWPFLGKLNWGIAAATVAGVGIIFSAPKLVLFLSGDAANGQCDTGTV